MTDMTLSEALNECGKWGNLMRALGKIDEVVKLAAQLEQAKADSTKVVEDLQRQADGIRSSIKGANADFEKAKLDAVEVLKDARAQAAKLIDSARADAAKIVNDAKADATQFIDSAETAKSQLLDTHQQLTAAKAEHASIQDTIEQAKKAAKAALASLGQ